MQKLTLKELLDLIEPTAAVLINADTHDSEYHETISTGPWMANDIAERQPFLFDKELYDKRVQRIFPGDFRGKTVLVIEIDYPMPDPLEEEEAQ